MSGLGIAAKVSLFLSELNIHSAVRGGESHPRVLSLDCMWSALGVSLCLNIVFLVVGYFEVVLTHTGSLVFFKSTSRYDSIISNSWKRAHEALQYRLEKVDMDEL